MARLPTKGEIAAFLAAHGIVDFVSGGRLTRAEQKAVWKAISRLGPPVARGTGMALGSVAAPIAARAAPVALPAIAAFEAYEMGKRDAEAIQGGEMAPSVALQTYPNPFLINPSLSEKLGVTGAASEIDLFTPIARGRRQASKTKKKVSSYAKAVKQGMAAVKRSKFNGKPGKITNAKKTFSTVSKVVSAVNRGKKVSSKGVRGTIARAARKVLPRRKK
jgi:hypothetical protein